MSQMYRFLRRYSLYWLGVSMAAWQQLQISRYAGAWMKTGAPTYIKLVGRSLLGFMGGRYCCRSLDCLSRLVKEV